jgi:hypothetical protein
MTNATDSFAQPLRLLRETSLRPGFEERLAERLSAVASERKVLRTSRWKNKRGLLLLAAIALPAGALAARGWFDGKHNEATVNNAVQQVRSTPAPKPGGTTGVAAFAQPKAPAMPSVEGSPIGPIQAQSRGGNAAQPARRAESRKPAVRRSVRPVMTASQPKLDSAASSSAPAKIESLEVSIPRGGSAAAGKTGAGEKTNEGMRLRSAASDSVSRTTATRDRSGAERDRAGDHRGNDGAQQARERVQARERKGQ